MLANRLLRYRCTPIRRARGSRSTDLLERNWRGSRLFPFLSLSDSKAEECFIASLYGFAFSGKIFK